MFLAKYLARHPHLSPKWREASATPGLFIPGNVHAELMEGVLARWCAGRGEPVTLSLRQDCIAEMRRMLGHS